ncbi:MAG: DNA-3-methyladenine glycosylase I [Chloroflexia bacterium]|nr:DNA-3-methyladenine glycosylase I [Chloroflexia bacterium]
MTGLTATPNITNQRPRCAWVGSDPLMVAYHDEEWGVPCRDDRLLFERLMLEGFQAGLSWRTVLHKRAAFARAFAGWDPAIVAQFGEADVARLLADPGIIRNRAKVAAAIANARACLRLHEQGGSLAALVWSFVDDLPQIRRPQSPAEVPAFTPEAAALSRELKRRAFTFVGPTICYAFMQSAGLIDDHLAGCFRASTDDR